jgi:hypothetical protein
MQFATAMRDLFIGHLHYTSIACDFLILFQNAHAQLVYLVHSMCVCMLSIIFGTPQFSL